MRKYYKLKIDKDDKYNIKIAPSGYGELVWENRRQKLEIINLRNELKVEKEKNLIAKNTVHSIENDLMLKNGVTYFVPIAKIKRKIEELEKDILNYKSCTTVWYQLGAEIDILQELLEEPNNEEKM